MCPKILNPVNVSPSLTIPGIWCDSKQAVGARAHTHIHIHVTIVTIVCFKAVLHTDTGTDTDTRLVWDGIKRRG
jgi:hypothetical protein